MKKNYRVTGILCLALLLGLCLSACEEAKDESTPLEGTWEADGQKLIISGKNFTQLGEGYGGVKGTFTLEGDKITITPTSMSMDDGKTWLTLDQLDEATKQMMEARVNQPQPYKLSSDGKTLTMSGTDYKKV